MTLEMARVGFPASDGVKFISGITSTSPGLSHGDEVAETKGIAL